MNRLSATIRLTFGLVLLTLSMCMGAFVFGFVPDRRPALIEGRTSLCESIAINCSLYAARGDTARMEAALKAIAERNPDMLSAGVRYGDGRLIVEVADHRANWQGLPDGQSTDSAIVVPISAGGQSWGSVEVRFKPLPDSGPRGWMHKPVVQLAGWLGLVGLPIYFLYLRRMLRHLDPSQVIPDRVRAALDTLSGGLLVLDRDERIVLANKSFASTLGQTPESLQGVRASHLPWQKKDGTGASDATFPWSEALNKGVARTGVMLGMDSEESQSKTFMVNSTPILGDDGVCRGALTSFDDVTQLEHSRAELAKMLDLLKSSQNEIHRQNEELKVLATKDPLTSCLNRRSFRGQFETHWNSARRHGHALSCVMVDIDHFKSVNDNHGHAVGDVVLQKIAAILTNTVRDGDLVCRYGGEEFCVLLPHLEIDDAKIAAERYRRAVEAAEVNGLSVTASLGVSALSLGANDPQELINEADKCLYVAKRKGRNQVVGWDDVPDDLVIDESKVSRIRPPQDEAAIPFPAVTALVSALSFRDQWTAEHSRRVADLCVATANGLMNVSETYVLEIAALLHDIGKITVPDSILLKAAPLTPEEKKVMRAHDRNGVEIIRSTFAAKELAKIVLARHAWFRSENPPAGVPNGAEIPLAARILAVADAYDGMVSDRSYRKGIGQDGAFQELRAGAGSRFDPELVKRLIATVQARDENRARRSAAVSKQSALKIGLEMERLAQTLDARDFPGVAERAGRLKTSATKTGACEIAELAARLEHSARHAPDLKTLIKLTQDLMDFCQSAQRPYLKKPKHRQVSAADDSVAGTGNAPHLPFRAANA